MTMTPTRRFTARLLLIAFVLMPLAACSYFKFPGVYRIKVLQGNIITVKDVNKLKVGMTKRQVQFVMGTPLIQDTFNPDRWDYYYALKRGNTKLRDKSLTIFFENDQAVRFEGDTLPVANAEEKASESDDTSKLTDEEVENLKTL